MISGNVILFTVILFVASHLIAFLFSLVFVLRMKPIDLLRPAFFMETDTPGHPAVMVSGILLSAAVLAGTFPLADWVVRLYYYALDLDNSFVHTAYRALLVFSDSALSYMRWLCAGLILFFLDQIIRYCFPNGILRRAGIRSFNMTDMLVRFRRQWLPILAAVTCFYFAASDSAKASFALEEYRLDFEFYCPADMMAVSFVHPESNDDTSLDLLSRMKKNGLDPEPCFSESISLLEYGDPSLTYGAITGSSDIPYYEDQLNEMVPIYRCSDYHRVARLYGREEISLSDGEYALVSNEADTADMFSLPKEGLSSVPDITIFGHSLHSFRDIAANGFMEIGFQPLNHGFYVIRDNAVDESHARKSWLIAHFAGSNPNETKENEIAFRKRISELGQKFQESFLLEFRSDVAVERKQFDFWAQLQYQFSSIMIFVICGTIFALILIFDTIDNSRNYTIMEILGDEWDGMEHTVRQRSLVLFLSPLLVFLFVLFRFYHLFRISDPVFTLTPWSFLLVAGRMLLTILPSYGLCFLFALTACRKILRTDRKNGILETMAQ